MAGSTGKFYIGIFKDGGTPIAHTSAPNPADAASIQTPITMTVRPVSIKNDNNAFNRLFSSYVSIMETYRSFIPLTLQFGPAIAPVIGAQRLESFANRNGKAVIEHSGENHTVYEMSFDHMREFTLHQDEVLAAVRGASHVPEVMIIGLISSYDAFLSNLLKTVFDKRSEAIFKSDKTVPFSELFEFSTIEDAKQYLIDKEVENVIRQSHHEQFSWIEKNLDVKLKEGLDAWPAFIELCERRNLLTHTGGIVSKQYMKNCTAYKSPISGTKIGDRLKVSPSYFSDSVSIVYEIGIKLCYVMWRKFDASSSDAADTRYNELCFDLIFNRAYRTAEQLLKFGVFVLKKFGGSERTRRMMVINLANAMRLQNRQQEATKLISEEDWSAVSSDFRLCASAVSGDLDAVINLMKAIGANNPDINIENYRMWPVFREHRKEEVFTAAFREIFGEDIIKPSSAIVIQNEEAEQDDTELSAKQIH